MIANKPRPEDFDELSIQYLAQSLDLVLNTEVRFGDHFLIDYDLTDELWSNHKAILGNAFMLLFLSIENHFKSYVCQASPLLLLSGEPKKWGVKGDEKEFEELLIHQFEDLIILYQELKNISLEDDIHEELQNLRKTRNRFTHGLISEDIEPSDLFQTIYVFLVGLWGVSWKVSFSDTMLMERMYGLTSEEEKNMNLLSFYKLFEKYLADKQFRELIGMPLRGRRFICPLCYEASEEAGLVLGNTNYAILNQEDFEVVCYLCDSASSVKSKACIEDACKCEVIGSENNICLGCGTEQI